MEENEKSDVETVQAEEERTEEAASPTRDEILAASRKENKNGDERETQTYNKALQLGYSVGFMCLALIMLVNIIVQDVLPVEMWISFSAIWATSGLYYGIKTNTKRRALFLTEGIFCSGTFIFFLVAWILRLCGVWVF